MHEVNAALYVWCRFVLQGLHIDPPDEFVGNASGGVASGGRPGGRGGIKMPPPDGGGAAAAAAPGRPPKLPGTKAPGVVATGMAKVPVRGCAGLAGVRNGGGDALCESPAAHSGAPPTATSRGKKSVVGGVEPFAPTRPLRAADCMLESGSWSGAHCTTSADMAPIDVGALASTGALGRARPA